MIVHLSTFFSSASALIADEPDSTAHSNEVRKSHEYDGLSDPYIFHTIAVESSGVRGTDTDVFIARLGPLAISTWSEGREA